MVRMELGATLAAVEAAIADGRLDEATATLEALAHELLARAPEPEGLAHATWLAGVISLRRGDPAAFATMTRHAVAALRLAGEDARARTALATRDELIEQLADVARVQERGAAGLMEVLDRHGALLLAIAAGGGWHDPRWVLINRQRALLPALVALVEVVTGAPAPLARVIDELDLDAVECTLLATIAPLTHAGRPLRPNQLARTCFADSYAHDEALLRLRDDSRLVRGRAIVPTARGELALAPELVTRLYGAR